MPTMMVLRPVAFFYRELIPLRYGGGRRPQLRDTRPIGLAKKHSTVEKKGPPSQRKRQGGVIGKTGSPHFYVQILPRVVI